MKAIIYTSNTGTTAEYAKLIGDKTGIPVYSIKEATSVTAGTPIIYLGWLMAGGIKGYAEAAKKWKMCAVCAVGMSGTGTRQKEVRERNQIEDSVPLFTLQGGYDITKLHGMQKMMMKLMSKTLAKELAEKQDRTPDEDRMYDMLLHGGNYVSEDNLKAVYEWLEQTVE